MKNKFWFRPQIIILFLLLLPGCRQKNGAPLKQGLTISEGEKWWGGAVVDGRKMPLGGTEFEYDQFADCRGNQAAPLYISDRGRYIWSEKPLSIEIKDGRITVGAKGGEVISGKEGGTLKEVFSYASRHFFPPSGKMPEPLLFTNPQYNTWIELQYNQNEADILKYAENILANGFPAGVIMIDDNWQDRYGTWKFDCEKFTDPKGMVKKLHNMGFKVMLWVVPFISPDSPVYRQLAEKKVLVFADDRKTRPAIIRWWNGASAAIDLSNPEGKNWFREQLSFLVREFGIDGFKFDGGDPESYLGTYSFSDCEPNGQSEAYAAIGLDFPLNEYRACWKMAGQPLVQRLRDKNHIWTDVEALIPDMINLGLIGHQFGCPDMIGGGDYVSFRDTSVLDGELIVRSAQVSALMPMMQFSVAPWRVLDKKYLDVCKNMALLHFRLGKEILELAKKCSVTGEPMVRNLEYEFPGKGYEGIKDQFLLGGEIMIAPVVKKGQRSREVVFPEGRWKGDDGTIVNGPDKLKLKVPLERLPWFRKIND